mmetsp:Transcript_17668/g.28921  ORF Transcript_17668/g.28921 Transcript_17668/m.28921 type:complete len:221 (+) Transcript_17668:206-868(+)
MVANQAMNAADDDSNNLNAKWKMNLFQVGLNVPDFIDSDVESEFVLSNDVPLKPLCDIKHPTLRVNARSSYGQSTQQSASVPALSTWAKQGSSPPIKRAHRTWKEISSEINRFAADNMKNAGWEDLWANKNKSQDRQQVDETDLAYLSSRTLHDICKAETVFRDSLLSQQKLQAWDKMMGLKRSHSRTMTKSSVTRKKMIHILRELKIMRERDEEREGKN